MTREYKAGFFFCGSEFFPWTAEDVAKAIEDECDRHRAKDAEIAKLRGEIEKLRGVRVALADLQVSDEVRDQLAAIEREVREVHAEEIASLRAEVARLRQPPPSPSRGEPATDMMGRVLGRTVPQDSPSRDTYTVEVPAALVERVREARCRLDATANRPADSSMTPADVGAVYFAEDAATRALADAVLSQLSGGDR
jgi:hypothetical protein